MERECASSGWHEVRRNNIVEGGDPPLKKGSGELSADLASVQRARGGRDLGLSENEVVRIIREEIEQPVVAFIIPSCVQHTASSTLTLQALFKLDHSSVVTQLRPENASSSVSSRACPKEISRDLHAALYWQGMIGSGAILARHLAKFSESWRKLKC